MKKIFTPIKIKELEVKNRIVMSPMCTYSTEDGFVNDFHMMHYTSRALGQVGIIVVEATAISPEGRISNNDLGIWDDKFIPNFKKLTDSIKKYGCVPAIQLAHAGRKSENSLPSIGVSNVTFSEKYTPPKVITIDEIKELTEKFINATKRAIEAGFEIIELHGAHGYLINQFLSPLTNTRDDEYGGSLKNRAKFLKDIVNSVRNFYNGVLFLRISATDYHKDGNTVKDYIKIFKDNDLKNKIDLIDVSSGGIIEYIAPKTFEGYQVKYSAKIKKETNILTSSVGMLGNPILASNVLEENKADLIFLGRSLLKDANWVLNSAYKLKNKIDIPYVYKGAYL